MCTSNTKTCACGSASADFAYRDEVMPDSVVEKLFCPRCSSSTEFDSGTMLKDNGWIIKYDMDVARFSASRVTKKEISPEWLFDEGYCTWQGVHPGDLAESAREREELLQLSVINPRKYFEEFRKWGIQRMDKLAREGWRKANAAA